MKRILLALLACTAFLLPLGAEATLYPGLFRYKLDNGIELFVYKDTALPLARVEVCFRAGAISQSQDTVGYFHLYEHLAFGGDVASGGADSAKAALASIGAAEWNGSTSVERMDYWLSLPADKAGDGMRFWADRLRPPDFSAADLEAAKDSVVAELKAKDQNPDTIYDAALEKRLFAKYPWRRDAAGNEAMVRSATPETMAKIRDTWIVPNNMALIVAGDVDPEAMKAAASSAFAAWKAADDPWKKASPAHPKPGVVRPTWMVYPDAAMPEGVASVELRYRGPDLGADPQASYAADLWTALVADPDGRFKTSVEKSIPKLYGADPIAAYYVSRREGGTLSISAYFATDAENSAVDRARAFKERVRGYEITTMHSDSSYFTSKDYAAARKRLEGSRAMTLETADGLAENLAYYWSAASGDYFAGYDAAIAKTGSEDVSDFIENYILRNLEVIALRMNPADFEKEKKSFANSGFDVVTAGNAFWWQK